MAKSTTANASPEATEIPNAGTKETPDLYDELTSVMDDLHTVSAKVRAGHALVAAAESESDPQNDLAAAFRVFDDVMCDIAKVITRIDVLSIEHSAEA